MQALSCLTLLLAASLAAEPSSVILVRHAERAGAMNEDGGLTEAGHCRAKMLSSILVDAQIGTIFTSEAIRTKLTAEPLAAKLNITPQVVRAADMDALIAAVRASTGVVLVVGHSNTVPAIAKRLGAGNVAPINGDEYNRLIAVTPGTATALTLRFPGCP